MPTGPKPPRLSSTPPAIEHRDNAVSIKGFKLKLFRYTLSASALAPNSVKSFSQNNFTGFTRLMHLFV